MKRKGKFKYTVSRCLPCIFIECTDNTIRRVITIILDIHSHILPGVDDGAADLNESVKLLEALFEQGVTDVVATPHFYPMDEDIDSFKDRIGRAYLRLWEKAAGRNLPNIYLGAEVLYYRYIGNSDAVKELCIGKTNYMLLELSENSVRNGLFEDIAALRENQGITPIIAHLERYSRVPGYKKLLRFLSQEKIPAQVNASSFFQKNSAVLSEKLIKDGYVNFLATDCHSCSTRPPLMKQALMYISEKLGSEYSSGFIRNSQIMLEVIKDSENEKQHA